MTSIGARLQIGFDIMELRNKRQLYKMNKINRLELVVDLVGNLVENKKWP